MLLSASQAQLALLCLTAVATTTRDALADLPPGTRRNTYLPPEPTKGYDYSKPTGPGFPSPSPPPGPTRPPYTPSRPYPGKSTSQTPDYTGSPSSPGHSQHEDGHVHEPGMPFDFNYAVKEDTFGNDYSHNAISDGDVTTGVYRVQLPDGRTQIVRYTADWKHGFTAQVSYEGTPHFDPPRPIGPGPGSGPGSFQGY
ncbi:PREDICTED: pro-resilin-like [Ceratosolen solmsi marchali]|uniref:Pro-resilin-like n=1 Tax=Ceratosolen solmsi marchali TaxID=326594 RepID=A0AAJ6YGK4_9HYME|nr:PREDICTED: pro-resilin-like [Ceratosolen solmsi marchali]